MNRASDAPVAPAIVEQASHWLMLQWDGELDAQQHQAFSAWQAADPEHQRAWQRLQRLQQTLGRVPNATARSVLEERPRRRALLKHLAVLLAAGGAGYLGQRVLPWREAMADERTMAGEVRHLQLSDGSRLSLNSASRVNIRFDGTQRRVQLLEGEVLLSSAKDPRPLFVETPAGIVQALGTRFGVRLEGDASEVELFEGALMIRPQDVPAQRLEAGHGLWFRRSGIGPQQAAQTNSIAWVHGRLIAEHQALGVFLRELARHRPGVIRCEASVARLPITGVFALADSDQVLATLQQTLPVKVEYLTRYWVTVKAR